MIMYQQIYNLVSNFIARSSNYISYNLEDDFDYELNPTYFDDYHKDIITRLTIHFYLVYKEIRPACMVLNDDFIFEKMHELYKSENYNKFIKDLNDLTGGLELI